MGKRFWSAHLERPVLADCFVDLFAFEWIAPLHQYAVSLGLWPISGPLLYQDTNIGHLSVDRRGQLHLQPGLAPLDELRRRFRRNLRPGRSADRLAVLCPIQLFPARYSKPSSLDYFLNAHRAALGACLETYGLRRARRWDIVRLRDWHPARADFPAVSCGMRGAAAQGLAICRPAAGIRFCRCDTGAQEHGTQVSRCYGSPHIFYYYSRHQPEPLCSEADFHRPQGRAKIGPLFFRSSQC